MMKLSLMRDVFETVNSDWDCELASELVKNWNHNTDWVKMGRASANFVCYIKNNEDYYVIRFNHDSERSHEKYKSEIDLLLYLESKNISVSKPVLSNSNKYVEQEQTKYGKFYSTVFECINGDQNEIENLKNKDFATWGESLGKLHKSFKELPEGCIIKRDSHEKMFEDIIKKHPPKDDIELKEVEHLRQFFKTLQKSESNFGLIHYDFELDNVIWNDEGLHIIDFDDSIYSWFVADIAYALRDIFDDGKEFKPNDERYLLFIKSYRNEVDISEEELSQIPDFYRLHHYITFKKLQRSVDLDLSDTNPDWLNDLITKLTTLKSGYYEGFSS